MRYWRFLRCIITPPERFELALDAGGVQPIEKEHGGSNNFQRYHLHPRVEADKLHFDSIGTVGLFDDSKRMKWGRGTVTRNDIVV